MQISVLQNDNPQPHKEVAMKREKTFLMMMVMVSVIALASGCAYWAKTATTDGPEPPEAIGPEPEVATADTIDSSAEAEVVPEKAAAAEPQVLKSSDGYTYRVLEVTDSQNNKVMFRDEAPGATDVVIRVWVQSQNQVYARNLDPSRYKVGQMVPVPSDWPLGDVKELPVMSGFCSGCLDYLDQYGGQLRIGEDTSGYNARVLLGLGYDPPISGRYRPTQNDCSGPTASLPEVIEPTKRARLAPIYLTDADPDLEGEGVFVFNSTKLTGPAQTKLEAMLATAPGGQEFVVEAGCDQCGTNEFNDDLSQRRVQAITKFLRSRGFKVVGQVAHGEKLAKVVPKSGDCDEGFPDGAADRFLKIHPPV